MEASHNVSGSRCNIRRACFRRTHVGGKRLPLKATAYFFACCVSEPEIDPAARSRYYIGDGEPDCLGDVELVQPAIEVTGEQCVAQCEEIILHHVRPGGERGGKRGDHGQCSA